MKWPRVSLKSLSVLGPQYGANVKAVVPSGREVRYVRITDIDEYGQLRPDSIAEPEGDDLADYVLAEGDLLLARTGATVGKTYRYRSEDGQCAFAGYLIRFRPNPRFVFSTFLSYYFQTSEYWAWIENKKRVAAQPNVNGAEYASLEIPLPPPREQQRIVELLEEADRLRRLSRDANVKAARILPALFLNMFGDPATNPKRWTPTTVGQVLKATDYGTSTKASEDGTGLPLIRMGNVDYAGNLDLHDLKFINLPAEEAAKYRIEKGDLLFNRTNSIDLVGKTGLWDVDLDAVLASYFIRVRVDREQAEPEFLWAYMNSAFMKRVLRATARGAIGQANINTTELRSLPLYRPPLDLQKNFVEKLRAIRHAIPAAEASAKLEALFSLLLQRAFSGQLTATWREAHLKELLAEMEGQARQLNLPMPQEAEV